MPKQIFFNLPEEKRNAIVTAAVRSFGAWHGAVAFWRAGLLVKMIWEKLKSGNVLIFTKGRARKV